MQNHELIDSILSEADIIPAAAEKLKKYNYEVFNYKPRGGWSAAECFDHLIVTNKTYIPVFEGITRNYTREGEKAFKNSFIGKFLLKAIHPDAPRKVKTSQVFYPLRSNAGTEIIDEYLNQHDQIKRYMESFREFDLRKIKIKSPMSSIVKYNLGDACKIIIYHDMRHLKQADRAVESYFSSVNTVV